MHNRSCNSQEAQQLDLGWDVCSPLQGCSQLLASPSFIRLQVSCFQVSGDLLVLTSVRMGRYRPWWSRLRDLSNSCNCPTSSFAPGGHRRIVTAPGRDLSTFRQYRTPSVAPGGHRRIVTAPGRDLSTFRRCYTHSFTPGGHGRVVTAPGRDLSTPRRITLTYLAKPKLG